MQNFIQPYKQSHKGKSMSKKILLVEHSSYEANLTQRVLKNLGYQVCHVQLGASVASQISQFQPDLVLLNTDLADFDSFDMCKTLKSNAHTQLLPIIMFGKADLRPDSAICAYEAGANYYFSKDTQLGPTLGILTRLVFERTNRRQSTGFIEMRHLFVS